MPKQSKAKQSDPTNEQQQQKNYKNSRERTEDWSERMRSLFFFLKPSSPAHSRRKFIVFFAKPVIASALMLLWERVNGMDTQMHIEWIRLCSMWDSMRQWRQRRWQRLEITCGLERKIQIGFKINPLFRKVYRSNHYYHITRWKTEFAWCFFPLFLIFFLHHPHLIVYHLLQIESR